MKPRLTTKTQLEVDAKIDELNIWTAADGRLMVRRYGTGIILPADPATWRELAALLVECADLVEGTDG
jgi:hypothetical protein